MDIEKLQGNVDAQDEGVWVKFNEGDWEFKIASAHSAKAQKWLNHAMSRARKRHRNVVFLPEEVSTEITRDWIINCILKDWRNVTSQGQPLECTPANVKSLLEMESIGSRVSDFLANECRDMENFGVEFEAKQEGDAATAAIKSGAPVES